MNDEYFSWKNLLSLDPEKVAHAVTKLTELFATYPEADVADLKARIAENREGWIHGREQATCWGCRGKGTLTTLRKDLDDHLYETASDFDAYWDQREALMRDSANHGEPEICPQCEGAGFSHEMSFHFGWGMAMRNFFRGEGVGEAFLGIENLDDVYTALIEKALGYEAPE